MKTCQAFDPVAGTRKGWLPCARKSEPGSLFCRKHGDAALGMMLGALAYQKPIKEGAAEEAIGKMAAAANVSSAPPK